LLLILRPKDIKMVLNEGNGRENLKKIGRSRTSSLTLDANTKNPADFNI
jgi:hypothetical protein